MQLLIHACPLTLPIFWLQTNPPPPAELLVRRLGWSGVVAEIKYEWGNYRSRGLRHIICDLEGDQIGL